MPFTAVPPAVVTATPQPQFPTAVVVTNTPTPQPVMTGLPPRDPAQDIPVVYGAVANGIISNQQVATYYRFDGQAGDLVDISAEATIGGLDTYLFLMDGFGNILLEDDDGGEGTNSRIQYTLQAPGSYVIIVSRYNISSGFTTGEFRMTLNKLN